MEKNARTAGTYAMIKGAANAGIMAHLNGRQR